MEVFLGLCQHELRCPNYNGWNFGNYKYTKSGPILQNCPLLKTLRDKTWPTATPLSIKLYGSKQDLEATASFVSLSGLAV
jgi:hypothetical protein